MLEIISIYLGIFILGIGEVIFAKIVLDKNIKVSKSKLCILLFIFTLFYSIVYVYLDGIVKSSVMYLLHVFEYKFLFDLKFSKSLFLTFIYAVVLVVVDILVLLIFTNLIGINKVIYYNEFAGSILGNFTICIFFILLTYILKKLLRKLINTEISHNIKILIFSLATFISVGMIFYSIIRTYEVSNDILMYLVAMLVLIVILFSLIKQTIENNRLTKEYDNLLVFMTTYENEIEKQRILRHETKNEFLTIKAKLCDKQKEKEIIEYIDEILKDKITINQEKYAKFGYLPPNGIKGLCYFKIQEAENLGVNVAINVSSRIKETNIGNLSIKNQRDLGKILGVFLDNAIEASVKSESKQLGLEVYVNKKGEFSIIISNSYDNNINQNIIGKESFSTKGKDRGHGLLLVKHIIEKNKIFDIKTNIDKTLYIQIISIKKD